MKKEKPFAAWVITPIAIVVVLLILYCGSAGPVVYLQTSGRLVVSEGTFLAKFYYPLNWAERAFRPFGNFMHWYGQLWYYEPPSEQ